MPNNFFQLICENLHYMELLISHVTEETKCSICNKPIIWKNLVVNDNDQQEGYINPLLAKRSLLERKPMKPSEKLFQIGVLHDMGTFYRYHSSSTHMQLYEHEKDYLSISEFYNIFSAFGYRLIIHTGNPSKVYINI